MPCYVYTAKSDVMTPEIGEGCFAEKKKNLTIKNVAILQKLEPLSNGHHVTVTGFADTLLQNKH
jgi:hypothetical protein